MGRTKTRMSGRVVLLALGMGLLACACEEEEAPAASYRPERDAAALRGSAVAGSIVVDFQDGTTKEQFDAWEAEWGVDVEFNSIEGSRSGITRADGVSDVASLLPRLREHPEVEAAEPLYTYRHTMTPLPRLESHALGMSIIFRFHCRS